MTSTLLNLDHTSNAEQSALKNMRDKVPAVAKQFDQWMAEKALPLLHLPERQDDMEQVLKRAAQICETSKHLLVLGTGGSSLGGQTLCSLTDSGFPVTFVDNVDPHTIARYLTKDHIAHTHLLLISKSGGTLETLAQGLVLLKAKAEHFGTKDLAAHASVITMPGDRALRELAAHYNLPVIDHDPDVGGRFSVLSSVGLLPAAVAGLDVQAIRAGAADAIAKLKKDPQKALDGACWQAAMMDTRTVSVMMPYCDRLECFSAWFKQLWAESLGKDGLGSTPCDALGAVDQHSQLQLWLDGPKNKIFTIFTVKQDDSIRIPAAPFDGFEYLKDKSMGDVLVALQEGTIETLKRHHLPMRVVSLPDVSERIIGEWLMQMMLETIAVAQMIGVDAFDQPAVEESKILARATLNGEQASAA